MTSPPDPPEPPEAPSERLKPRETLPDADAEETALPPAPPPPPTDCAIIASEFAPAVLIAPPDVALTSPPFPPSPPLPPSDIARPRRRMRC